MVLIKLSFGQFLKSKWTTKKQPNDNLIPFVCEAIIISISKLVNLDMYDIFH